MRKQKFTLQNANTKLYRNKWFGYLGGSTQIEWVEDISDALLLDRDEIDVWFKSNSAGCYMVLVIEIWVEE